jgi:hypothetical protein
MNLCKYCFKVLERDDDGDRYYYQCPDINCLFWENGHNENVDRIAEGIKEHLDEIMPLKAIEVKAALTKVLETYDNRVMQISKEFD